MGLNELRALRETLHKMPERSGQEQRTMETIIRFLRTHTTMEVRERKGWFYALHREPGAERTIAVRGDMDAIENSWGEAFHGCGHDGHSTILAGLGVALEGVMCGKNVCLVFQPGEENGTGGARVCEELLGELRPECILGYHNIPGYPVGTVLLRPGTFACASLGLELEVKGQQSHAAYPEQGENPADLISRLVLLLPELIREIRQNSPGELLMVTVVQVKVGERNFGVSAGTGTLALTLRAERQGALERLEQAITAWAKEACEVEKMSLRVSRQDVFPDTVNETHEYAETEQTLRRAGISTWELTEPMRWSEDFGWYLREIPGVYLGLGAGESCAGLHADHYAFPDALLEPAVTVLKTLVEQR